MIACALLTIHLCAAPPAGGGFLYRATLLQAAPGKLLEVLDLYRSGWPGTRDSGDEPPFAMRHSQGDRWDLLLLFPMASHEQFYARERILRREKAASGARAELERLSSDTAWQEDLFVFGPPLEEVRERWRAAGFYHVEMFQALPGKRAELSRERAMENAYSKALGLPEDLIFVKLSGAAWDLFSVGAFRDLRHYAEGSAVPEGKAEEAARAAGFEGAKAIGPYLRTLIALHHDTLAVAVK